MYQTRACHGMRTLKTDTKPIQSGLCILHNAGPEQGKHTPQNRSYQPTIKKLCKIFMKFLASSHCEIKRSVCPTY